MRTQEQQENRDLLVDLLIARSLGIDIRMNNSFLNEKTTVMSYLYYFVFKLGVNINFKTPEDLLVELTGITKENIEKHENTPLEELAILIETNQI